MLPLLIKYAKHNEMLVVVTGSGGTSGTSGTMVWWDPQVQPPPSVPVSVGQWWPAARRVISGLSPLLSLSSPLLSLSSLLSPHSTLIQGRSPPPPPG